MSNFKFEKTKLNEAMIIEPFLACDERGFFQKKFEKTVYENNGIKFNVSETLLSKSRKGVIRGLHFQNVFPQAKLVSVDVGKVYDVIVDIRKNSSTYGKWERFLLSEENNRILYVPKGFAHGFIALTEDVIVSYICDGKYIKENDCGIVWNDKTLNIDWGLDELGNDDRVIISEKDRKLVTFNEYNMKY